MLSLPDIVRKKHTKKEETVVSSPNEIEAYSPPSDEVSNEQTNNDVTAVMHQFISLFDPAENTFLDNTFDFLI